MKNLNSSRMCSSVHCNLMYYNTRQEILVGTSYRKRTGADWSGDRYNRSQRQMPQPRYP